MSAIPMPRSPSARLHPAAQCGVLLLASAGAAAAWTLLALALDRQIGWMAVLAALDAALVLRFVRMSAGPARMALAVAGTVLAIVLANWWIAGGQMGALVGLPPWDAIPRLGPAHAWTLLGLANGAAELAWYVVALAVAALIAR
jgi:hypothetical protein